LRDNGIEPNIIEYLKDIPTGTTLKDLAAKLGKHPNEFGRKGEADFKENNLQETLDNDRALIAAISFNISPVGMSFKYSMMVGSIPLSRNSCSVCLLLPHLGL